jgi:hypothetical protein
MRGGSTGAQRAGWLVLAALGIALWASQVSTARRETGPPAPPVIPPTIDAPQGDRWIGDMVFLRLVASPTVAPWDIGVEVVGGVATLRGVVPTAEATDRALRIAAWTPGVRDVRNDLAINPAAAAPQDATTSPDDVVAEVVARTLTREIFPDAHLRHSRFRGWQVDGGEWGFVAEVKGNDVVLSGSVPTIPDVRRAVEAARAAPGARTVQSLLYVRGMTAGEPAIFGPHGPYLGHEPRSDEPNRPGYGYYGPYPPPRGTPLIDYPSAVHSVWRDATDIPDDP